MTCSRCKGPDQYYIIRDELWATAASAGEHLLCLACVEDSLARPLALDDYVFTEAEIQARFHAPPPVVDGKTWAEIFQDKDETDHKLFNELSAGMQGLQEFYDKVLERDGGVIRSYARWVRSLDELYAADLAKRQRNHRKDMRARLEYLQRIDNGYGLGDREKAEAAKLQEYFEILKRQDAAVR
jgi:hypothetical protein